MTQTQESRRLTRTECLDLLPRAPFGRLVFTEGALPAVIPVDFQLAAAGLVVRTAPGSAVARVPDGAVVALQADDVDFARRAGWSVTVVGQARTARDPAELADLRGALPVPSWLAGGSACIVVEVGIVTGRRLGAEVPLSA